MLMSFHGTTRAEILRAFYGIDLDSPALDYRPCRVCQDPPCTCRDGKGEMLVNAYEPDGDAC